MAAVPKVGQVGLRFREQGGRRRRLWATSRLVVRLEMGGIILLLEIRPWLLAVVAVVCLGVEGLLLRVRDQVRSPEMLQRLTAVVEVLRLFMALTMLRAVRAVRVS